MASTPAQTSAARKSRSIHSPIPIIAAASAIRAKPCADASGEGGAGRRSRSIPGPPILVSLDPRPTPSAKHREVRSERSPPAQPPLSELHRRHSLGIRHLARRSSSGGSADGLYSRTILGRLSPHPYGRSRTGGSQEGLRPCTEGVL